MPDFTNVDPSLIASFWIYFVGSFVVGAGVGAIASKLFFHRQKEIIDQERKGYLDKIESLEESQKKLETENKKLKEGISNNALYWNAQKYEKQKAPGDKALFDLLHGKNGNEE